MRNRWIIFSLASFNFFISQFYRASNAVIAPQLLSDLSLDTGQLGLVSASFFYAFALAQIPISITLDRVGPRRMMTALSLAGVAGAMIFSCADSSGMAILGRVILGLGMACNLMGTLKLLTTWFEPLAFATLSGVVFSIGTVGNMIATTPLVLLVEAMGWRAAFQIIAGLNFFLVIIFYAVVRDQPEISLAGLGKRSHARINTALSLGMGSLFRNKDYWIISLGTFVGYGVFGAFQVLWAGPYLMEVLHLSPVVAGNIIFLMNLGLILGGPAWGMLSDRVVKTRKWIVVAGHLLFSAVILALAVSIGGPALALTGLLFFAFGFFRSTGTLMYTHIKEVMPIAMAGTAMTGINFFTMVGPAVFLQLLGTLMQILYPGSSRGPEAFQTVLLMCSSCMAFATLLYCFTSDVKGQRHD